MPGHMMIFSPEDYAVLEKAVEGLKLGVREKSMFGHRTLFLNGYMFAGACTDGIWLRVGKESAGTALARDAELAPFEPRKGMIMRDYIVLRDRSPRREIKLKKWLKTAADGVQKMPPKRTAGRTGKGRRP
jgi:TfoX/Sxy family transcriptional regulator of competence genes